MSKIPTAEEFFEEWCNKKGYVSIDEADDINECMIEFTKLHVELALEAASKNSKVHLKTYFGDMENMVEESKVFWGSDDLLSCYSTRVKVDKDSIINAYPLDNIK
jgi:hypothetical protein